MIRHCRTAPSTAALAIANPSVQAEACKEGPQMCGEIVQTASLPYLWALGRELPQSDPAAHQAGSPSHRFHTKPWQLPNLPIPHQQQLHEAGWCLQRHCQLRLKQRTGLVVDKFYGPYELARGCVDRYSCLRQRVWQSRHRRLTSRGTSRISCSDHSNDMPRRWL